MGIFGHTYSAPGSSPGIESARVSTGARARFRLIDYDGEHLETSDLDRVEDAFARLDADTVTWLDVVGARDVEAIRILGDHLQVHPLVLEDLVNLGQRPKLEEHEGYFFIVLRLIHEEGDGLRAEQIGLLVGSNWVVTVQELEKDCFTGVRERIRAGRPRIRGAGADYLAYALIDAVIDHFFPLLESYGERIEALEDEIAGEAHRSTLARIHRTKKDLLTLRRAAWPQREVIHAMQRDESGLIKPKTAVFLRDCYDHAIQIMDIVDNYRDLAGDLTDFYLSTMSNRTNEVMKVLTIMASIFIPLTFVAGIYGMNFNTEVSAWNMPELNTVWGYPGALLAMAAIGLAMVVYFRRKNWF